MDVQSTHAPPPVPHRVLTVPPWHVPLWQHPFGQEDREQPPAPLELLAPGNPLEDPPDEPPDEDDPPGPGPPGFEHVASGWHVPPTSVQSWHMTAPVPHALSLNPRAQVPLLQQPLHEGPQAPPSSIGMPPLLEEPPPVPVSSPLPPDEPELPPPRGPLVETPVPVASPPLDPSSAEVDVPESPGGPPNARTAGPPLAHPLNRMNETRNGAGKGLKRTVRIGRLISHP